MTRKDTYAERKAEKGQALRGKSHMFAPAGARAERRGKKHPAHRSRSLKKSNKGYY